jgi:thiol-disulfide isomerase/thioredoxin
MGNVHSIFWVAVLVAWLMLAGNSFGAPVKGIAIGDPLPAFNLPGVDGKNHTQDEYAKAKVLVVLFTCNHCPTAQAYEKRIMDLDAAYRGKGVVILAVSPNDDKAVRLDELGYSDLNDSLADMKIRAKQRGFKFPYLYDGKTQSFSRKMGVRATPHVFIFDAARKLRYNGRIDNSEVGAVKSHDMKNAIEDLLAGRDVKAPTTRTFGCSTKWAAKRGGVKVSDERWAKETVALTESKADALATLAQNKTQDYVLINIWATWCAPCVQEFPDLVILQRMYRRRHFKLVTISTDNPDQKADVLSFLKKQQAAMTNYLYTGTDKDKLADAVDAKWEGPVPHTIFIAPGGKVLYRETGTFNAAALKRVIADNLGRTYASRKKKK